MIEVGEAEPTTVTVPTTGEIFRFYYPLALSWLFMAVEMPIMTAVVSHAAGAEIHTAALQMMSGLALWIESPVIDLLATSTTLSRRRQDFAVISRFVWWLMGITAVVHAAVALTPLWGIVTQSILGIPAEVSDAARLPMAIMIPWSPFIGWRRYLQGILIRFGKTRLVGLGTGVRVCTMASTCLALYLGTDLSGIMIAAIALVSSVAAEALFIHAASRETVREELGYSGKESAGEEELSMGKLIRFHLPLTATTMTFMISLPLTSAAIARAPDSIFAMAAWQVATSLSFLHRCVVFALPEPVITLYSGPESARKLARFCFGVGAIASGLVVVFALIGADRFLFGRLLGASPEIVAQASTAYIATLFVPLLVSVQSYLRAMLTRHHFTSGRLWAVLTSTLVLFGLLSLGGALRWPGVVVAATGLTGAAMAEALALALAWRNSKQRLALAA